jgi:RNA polymerase-associated protein LEO1
MASATVDSPLAHSPSQSRSFNSDQEQDDADLFGDEDAGDAPFSHRKLDDSELDSGDDIGRNDRLEDGAEDTQDLDDRHSYSTKKFLPKTIGRLRAPEADNGEVSCVQSVNFRHEADRCPAISSEYAPLSRPSAEELRPRHLQATNRTS